MPDISRLVIEVDSKGVLQATGNLEVFSKMGHKAGKETDDMAKKFGAFQLIIDKLPGPMKSVVAGLTGMVSPAVAVVSAFLEIGEAAVKYVKESVDAFAKFEMIKTNLEVVSASAEEASATFSELQRMAGRTPFNVDQLAEAATMLRQTGISARDLIPTLEMLGNVSGGSAEKFSRISMNFAQIQSTMKATAMDIRQFAMANIPIYTVLEQMGVTGTATADDIEEAFRRMTEAGGQFYGAMEKGAQTLTGMKTNLEGLKEQFKALQAEYSGMSDTAKWWAETQIGYYQKQNQLLLEQIELKEIADRKETGTATVADTYREAELQIAGIRRQLEEINNASGIGPYQSTLIKNYETQLKLQRDIIKQYQPQIDFIAEMTKKQEEYNTKLADSEKGYRDLQARLEEDYGKTTEGQRAAIEEQIDFYKRALTETHLIEKTYDLGGGKKQTILESMGVSDKMKKQIEVVLRVLEESLDKVLGKAKEVKYEFTEWEKILSDTTGIPIEEFQDKSGSEAFKVIDHFMQTKSVDALSLSDMGLTDYATELDGIADIWEIIYKTINNAMKKVDGGYVQVFDPSLPENAKLIDNLFERVKESRADSQEALFDKDITGLKELLSLIEEYGTEYEKYLRLRELEEKYGSREKAEEVYNYEQSTEKVEALADALNQLKEAGLQLSASGLNTFVSDLGKALRDGSISGEEFSDSLKTMLRSMVDAMPQLLLNVGLQLMSTNWKLGLAFIGASGLMSFVSGMIGDAEQDGRNDEYERLKRIQEQITDLIEAQRKQQEYYLTQKRRIDSTAVSVNDAIITPSGIINTHPEDYIIATKHPETLMSGGGSNVVVNVINNAGVQIAQRETLGADGTREIQLFIDKIVQNGIATGRYDGAFNALNAKNRGRGLTH